jgi:lipopolysaccharide export LptBFGC system permease protein LptF
MNLNQLSNKKLANILSKSDRLIECKCGFKKIQKKPFESDTKDDKGYFIKSQNCNKKIYEQIILFKNKKVSKINILPIFHILKR